jgi:intracellular septation protein
MATLNGYVAWMYSTETWVNFKLWGYAFPVVFIIGQGLYIARYLKDDSTDPVANEPAPTPPQDRLP